MIKRIWIYLKEMFPVFSRLMVGLGLFFGLYFIILLNNDITDFRIGAQEIIGALTVFVFLLLLRIADDFKDYETDMKLFPKRPLPSGRVKKNDLIILLVSTNLPMIILNMIFMNNLPFFALLYGYGFLMYIWFFRKSKIQNNLVMALITHNPIQIIISIYVISFICIKYGINWATLIIIAAAFAMYLPALIWEVARKIRAPKDETEYVTYSKLFGYKKATLLVVALILLSLVTSYILVWGLNKIAFILLVINVVWVIVDLTRFIKNPDHFTAVSKVTRYIFIQEAIMVVAIVTFLMIGRM